MSRNSSMTRSLDPLGRVSIPKEIRTALGWKEKDRVRIDLDGNRVIITKKEETCVFCGEENMLLEFHGLKVCDRCRRALGVK